MLYKSRGVIIKKTNLGNTDRLITVYSKDFGKILVKAKSVRKNQAKLKGHLELFLYSHLMIAPGRGFDIITGAETIESFPGLHDRLSSLAVGYYLAELIDKLIVGPEKDENIWALFLSSLSQLNQIDCDTRTIVSNFESGLVEFLGYGTEKNNIDNVLQSFLGEKIRSKYFLQKTIYLLK